MAATTSPDRTRLALSAPTDDRSGREVSGAWWPEGRTLTVEIPKLFALWPEDRGRIARVLFSRPDWDDRPHSIMLPDRRVKSGSFPADDTRQLLLMMSDRRVHRITVVPADSSDQDGRAALDAIDGGSAT